MKSNSSNDATGFQAQPSPSKTAFDAVDLLLSGRIAEAQTLLNQDAKQAQDAAARQFGFLPLANTKR